MPGKPDKIEDLLHRRTDLSTFLVHLTRDSEDDPARDNLLAMLEEQTIEARTPLGMAKHLDKHLLDGPASQRVVCFSETPLEHTWMMVRKIDLRQQHFKPYGLVFSKTTCRQRGCNPVWYLDQSLGTHNWLTKAVDDLVDRAREDSKVKGTVQEDLLDEQSILRLTPFIETMGNSAGKRKEFWWEREWRHVGDFTFPCPRNVIAVLAPEEDHVDMEKDIAEISKPWERRRVPLLDPRWGLERMIAGLARVDDSDVGPWPA